MDLSAGRHLRFAGSGLRTILWTKEDPVAVDGAALYPRRDGWPNWIEIKD